jgi:peptide/nickel transport system ATP-binding protein
VEQGSTAVIFSKSGHPYTRGLLACRPLLTERPASLPTVEQYLAGDSTPVSVITAGQRKKEHERLYTAEPVLIVEKLAKKFGSFTALEKTSFGIYPGETLGIVGESGSGKTTLARVILQLIPPTEGRVIYQGKDITRLTATMMKKMRKELQIIFQDPYSSLNPRLTAGRAIGEPIKVHRLHEGETARRERVMELLRMVGLKPEHYDRYPHEFSGGQRQRICIARALAVEPRLIICDESVSALDVSIQAQVLNLLNDLKRNLGLTYIFISHDLSVVRYMSDRLIVMNKGKIVEMGEADTIYANPGSEYTKRLLEAIPGGQADGRTSGQADK